MQAKGKKSFQASLPFIILFRSAGSCVAEKLEISGPRIRDGSSHGREGGSSWGSVTLDPSWSLAIWTWKCV